MPGTSGIFDSASFWAARIASLTAAWTISASISAPPGSTASGSIETSLITRSPEIFTLTMPPPALASTSSSLSDSWAWSMSFCICWACFIRALISMPHTAAHTAHSSFRHQMTSSALNSVFTRSTNCSSSEAGGWAGSSCSPLAGPSSVYSSTNCSPVTELSAATSWLRRSGFSAFRRLNFEPAGNPTVRRSPSSPTGRVPSKYEAVGPETRPSAHRVQPAKSDRADQDGGHRRRVRKQPRFRQQRAVQEPLAVRRQPGIPEPT